MVVYILPGDLCICSNSEYRAVSGVTSRFRCELHEVRGERQSGVRPIRYQSYRSSRTPYHHSLARSSFLLRDGVLRVIVSCFSDLLVATYALLCCGAAHCAACRSLDEATLGSVGERAQLRHSLDYSPRRACGSSRLASGTCACQFCGLSIILGLYSWCWGHLKFMHSPGRTWLADDRPFTGGGKEEDICA